MGRIFTRSQLQKAPDVTLVHIGSNLNLSNGERRLAQFIAMKARTLIQNAHSVCEFERNKIELCFMVLGH